MASRKHLIITGISNISWKDATIKALNEVAKTVSDICEIKIINQYAKIKNNEIFEYFVDIDLAFTINEKR